MAKFRLLSKHEVNRLDIFKKIGRSCETTFFAKLLCFWDVSDNWVLSSTSLELRNGMAFKRIYYVTYSGDIKYFYDYAINSEDIRIRPVMKYSNLQQFKKSIQTDYDGVTEVEYGEYPQEEVPAELCDKLENFLINKDQRLKKTGKKYTVKLDYLKDNEQISPKQLVEYEYEGKKYVRIDRGGEWSWIEVSPIKWYVDETKKILISKKSLVSMSNIYYKKMPEFLNTYFAKEIVQGDIKVKEENKTMAKEKISPIEKIVDEIYKYLEDNPNKDNIIAKLVEMINEYNSKLDEVKSKKINNVMTIDTYESVTSAFKLKLEMMLVEVKKHHEMFKEYFDMMAILDKYISLINGNKDEEYSDSFISDLDVINTICLPFLKEEDANKIRKQLINIFNDEKKEIINYIDNNNKLSYKTIDEMILDLRRKIHPVLENLSTSVNKRDVEVEIKTTVSKIIDGLFDKPKNEALSFYLVEINNVYTNINALIDKLPSDMKSEYKRKILDIMNMEIDYTSEFNNIANDLKTMWLSLNKVLYKINSYLGEIDKLDFGRVDLNKFNR